MTEKQGRFHFDKFENRLRQPDQTLEEFAENIGVTVAAIQSWRRRGILFYRADELCTKLGIHPSYIWGEEYWNPVPRKSFTPNKKQPKEVN